LLIFITYAHDIIANW